MYLNFLRLHNFRNFADTTVEFGEKCNVIHGDNGQGKTNLLEAIIFLSTGRSFRTPRLGELIREKEPFFSLEAEIVREGIRHRIRIHFDGQNKHLQIDSNTYKHFNPLLGLMPTVLYAPEQGKIITGLPADRRRFLDLQLAQSDPLYVYHLVRFYRAMKQRNCLLRQGMWADMNCWEIEMTASAPYLQAARKTLTKALQPLLKAEGNFLSENKESHGIALRSTYTDRYLEELQSCRIKDQQQERTSIGPHRDDLAFFIDERPSRFFASQGQEKTTLAGLKISEWKNLEQKIGCPPLFCLDDIGHSLDPKRETLLCQILQTLGQVFITTPIDLQIPSHKIEIRGEGKNHNRLILNTLYK